MLACVCQPTDTSRLLLFEPPRVSSATRGAVPGTVVPVIMSATSSSLSSSSSSCITTKDKETSTMIMVNNIVVANTKNMATMTSVTNSPIKISTSSSPISSASSTISSTEYYDINNTTTTTNGLVLAASTSTTVQNNDLEQLLSSPYHPEYEPSTVTTVMTTSQRSSDTMDETSVKDEIDIHEDDDKVTNSINLKHYDDDTSTSVVKAVSNDIVGNNVTTNIQTSNITVVTATDDKLPDGVQLTLSELRDMAYRQQHQIESQHQLLAAKEQRLRYLKEQEARHQRVATENERLRRLRDRVEAQELKLRKLRALRGQVDQNKQNNALLTSDLDSIRALFNEKEKELSVAVAKVDELTRQLEDLRRGRASEPPSAAALELEKLRRELMYRNKLNEQQNARLNQQREALTQRQEEMSSIDKRISELQDRLHRKRILNQQLANQISAASNKTTQLTNQITTHGMLNIHQINNNQHNLLKKQQSRGNIAAIEPYNHIPTSNTTQDNHFTDKLQKNYFIPVITNQLKNTNLNQNDNNSSYKNHKDEYHELMNNAKKNNTNQQYQQNQQQQQQLQQQLQQQPQQQQQHQQQQPYNKNTELNNDFVTDFSASKSDPKYQTLPYNTKFSVNLLQLSKTNRDSTTATESCEKDKQQSTQSTDTETNVQNYTNMKTTTSAYQQHMTVHSTPLSTINKSLAVPLNQNDNVTQYDKNNFQKHVNEQKPLISNESSNRVQSHLLSTRGQPVGGPSSTTSTSSAFSTTVSQSISSVNSNQKPVNNLSSASSIVHGPNKLSTIYQTSSTKIQPVQPQTTQSTNLSQQPISPHINTSQPTSSIPVTTTPSTPTSLIATQVDTNNSNSNNDKSPKPILPPKPAIKPPPRQTQPSSVELTADIKNKEPPPPIPATDPPQENSNTVPPIHTIIKPNYDNKPIKAKPLTIKKQPPGEQPKLRTLSKVNGVHVSINRRIEMPPAFLFPENESPPSDLINSQSDKKQNINYNNNNINSSNSNSSIDVTKTQQKSQDTVDRLEIVSDDKLSHSVSDLDEENKKNISNELNTTVDKIIPTHNISTENVVRRVNKGNLKQTGKANLSRRVSFDPLALLLDASLEGELELVKKTATQVPNPSAANDEGITALHNAICAGHLEIVQFLVEFGCDVNAQDSDGWTPLHCAASCNNVAMVRFLVEHGACIFATTLSDHETAAEKCEEDEEGFDGCSEYLYSVQEKLGILCGGAVYAVFDYTAQQSDELSFSAGDQLTVIRKGDENEREWWWARLGDREGYIPRNLLGLYPRVTPKSTNE